MRIIKNIYIYLIKYKSLMVLILAFICYIMGRLMENHGTLVDKYYSSTLNKWLIQGLSQLTGLVSFSIGELLFVCHLIAIPIVLGMFVYKYKKHQFFKFFRQVISYILIVYILFMFLWGFNYSRISVAYMMDLQIKPTNTQELYNLTKALILKSNSLRNDVSEDSNGIMTIDGGYQTVFDEVDTGYQIIGQEYKELSGHYGKPKFILLSHPMLYTEIVGIYFPFTAEANVNIDTPDLFLPINTLHEMAHQRGIALEDEANYIAYLAAMANPDIEFQYSGTVFAMTTSMMALMKYDPESASELKALYSDGLKRDLENYQTFWKDYEGKVSGVADNINDTYLKGNGQIDGVQSYGRMVDLLLAQYRKFGEI